MNVTDKIKKEATVKISGVMLLYIANVLRERQMAIFRSMAEIMLDGDTAKADELGEVAMANEIVGQKIMDLIEKILGKEDFEKFIDGKLDFDAPEFMSTSSTIN